ncbi:MULTISPECIES: dihydrofolate reductase family protein [unclassified Crossiella]|uniref:dihydrofolate reductase family protein n=1 Tax=unclassified Crossiella TaxID=2620835 RepID=UPI001FFFD465|nr:MULTISPECIES: dihydrofolate reductase family protein [unclassified Crossiella]MCK2242792.1 dihydrofolate reductase family protein [Crossiella sp. S99.2]MCK2256669.1 dihydrofolate reductase family protein [Crossiella sp. S99.1]
MRRLLFSMGMSVDGCYEGPDREIDWHRVDEELHLHMNEQIRQWGMFLHGRVTHELMAAHWPTADTNPEAGPAETEFAGIWRDMPKWVYSSSPVSTEWNTTVKREVDPAEIRALKEQPGGDICVGGPNLARAFRQHDLIDEYRVYVHPVLLGRGRPLFPELDLSTDLRLAESRSFGNGVVLLRYER